METFYNTPVKIIGEVSEDYKGFLSNERKRLGLRVETFEGVTS